MFDEDDGLEDEFADEFDELFEEMNYLYYDDDSEDITGEEGRKRVPSLSESRPCNVKLTCLDRGTPEPGP